MIGGFQAPLHNGPVWSFVLPRFQVSLTDPFIYTLLQAYIQFSGFDMINPSEIAQFHTTTCLWFVSTTMPALNPNLIKRATSESVVVGPRTVTTLTLGFSQFTPPDEWKDDYQPLQPKFHSSKPNSW